MQRLSVLGLPLDPVNLEGATKTILDWLLTPKCKQVVTLNPEICVRAQNDAPLRQSVCEAELVTADGVGMLWAAERLAKVRLPERVSGIDLCERLFRQNPKQLRIFLLGARPGVAQEAAQKLTERFGVQIAGVQDGYFSDAQTVLGTINSSGANLLLVGMGERQEGFIHQHKSQLQTAVAIGVGGSLDVWSGQVKRVPAWAQRLRLEWLVRIGSDPKRWGRFPRLLRFVALVLRQR